MKYLICQRVTAMEEDQSLIADLKVPVQVLFSTCATSIGRINISIVVIFISSGYCLLCI